MNKNLILLILPIAISYGCVATHEDLGSLYAGQARLEAKTKKLSKQMEEVQFQSGSESLSISEEKIAELEARVANLERSYDRLRSMVRSSDRYSKVEPIDPKDSEKLFEKALASVKKSGNTALFTKLEQRVEEIRANKQSISRPVAIAVDKDLKTTR